MRTRVKICGITRPEDALAAARAGADAIGLVFYPPSPRAVSTSQAAAIVRCLPPFVSTVGLFVDALPEAVKEVLQEVPLDLLQFHGKETAKECERYGRPYIKALRMRPDLDLWTMEQTYHSAAGLLLDSYRPDLPGGTGEVFDWERIPDSMRQRIILAGGLSPDNVASAITRIHPYAVDVSGGVEREKGIKDEARISAFMRGVESAKRQDD
ncbi:MAG: phosphoribosylanthranilate isomerase [Sedimenticola sp.]|nr:phosphoribosylanthranilate isomerase [Sedimenticola sp.]